MANSLVKLEPVFSRWGMEWDFHELILGTEISKAEVAGGLRTVSAPAKGCSEGLDVSPEPAAAALPGARAAAGVPSSARAHLGQGCSLLTVMWSQLQALTPPVSITCPTLNIVSPVHHCGGSGHGLVGSP